MQTKAMIPIRTIAPAAPKQMMFSRFLEQYSLKLIFFVSTMNVFFSRETCDVCTLLFCGNRKVRQSNFYSGSRCGKYIKFLRNFLETVILFFLPESRPEDPPSDRKRLLSRGKLRSCPDGERECWINGIGWIFSCLTSAETVFSNDLTAEVGEQFALQMTCSLEIPGLSRTGTAKIQLKLLPQTITQSRRFAITVDRQ